MNDIKEGPKRVDPYARPIPEKCFKCNQLGHRSSDCPLRKAVNLINREDDDEAVYCEPDGDDDEDLFGGEEDDGQNYVVRRMMLAPKHDDPTQRHQLFRTRCTVNGKVFGVIIDSGSCENIIGREAVKKLGLPVERHPNPYTLGWIKAAAEKIDVRERCKVPFSIGKYKDEVYCDVVDMDACHVLLGRPWQYDVNAQHSGRSNIYNLEKRGVRFTLLPFKLADKGGRGEKRAFLTITKKGFESEMKETK